MVNKEKANATESTATAKINEHEIIMSPLINPHLTAFMSS